VVRSVPALRPYNPSHLALIPGTRLGPYEIVAAIGAGGMGEVYRATDSNLKRQVAIKVLLQTVAADPDRLARFQREAEVLAAVNHPNIAHVHGLEKSDGMLALVMELVEGLTLADRIAHGAIAIDEALPIAKQIAEALEAAHERGIIHRDLKPANIKVRADAMVKVLDFGLANALDVGSEGSGALSMSPTQSLHATQAGMILGTAAYMSPEQAAGKAVDKRTDLWAFGVVVMEMLTGQPVFTGETVPHVLASVLKSDPDWTALPATTPAALRRLLRRCLEKDRKRRLSDAADARLEIEEAMAAPRDEVAPSPVSAWRRALPWTVAAAFGVALVSALVLSPPWRAAPVPTPRKLLAFIGADASMPIELGASAILSPDGTVLAFAAQQAGQARLFVRKLDQLQATPHSGTEGAGSPFFSPDGQSIAFFAGGKLKTVSVAGGASIILCDAPNNRGGTWADDGTIIFTPVNGSNVTLMRVSAAGGKPAVFGTLSTGATTQRWPQALPGGKGVLYSEHSAVNGWDLGNLVVTPLGVGRARLSSVAVITAATCRAALARRSGAKAAT
jgi:eukaryotic-like serine/threonine-protein kinase